MLSSPAHLLAELEPHRTFLWGLCYRMTGCAADADDIVQDTFERALLQPPRDRERALRPWLVTVATNRARDMLRQRRRRGYKGPYLPSPIETPEPSPSPEATEIGPEARYGQLETVTFAFLMALEALTPTQRAVLLLRDVFDYSVEETAQTLGQSAANVRTTHHRARRTLQDYDAQRCVPTRERREKTRAALEAFLTRLASDDVDGLRALLAEDVITWNDTAGEFHAARRLVVGREKVIMFHRNLDKKLHRVPTGFSLATYNGFAGLLVTFEQPHERVAPKVFLRVDVDDSGVITQIHAVLATRKLSAARVAAP